MGKYILYCGGVLTCDNGNTKYDNLSGINGSYSSYYDNLINDNTNPTDATAFVYDTDNSSLNVVHSCCSPKMKCTYEKQYTYDSFNLFNNIDNNIWSEEYFDNDDNLLFSFLAQYNEGNRLPHAAPSWFGYYSIKTVKYTFVNENDRYGGDEHNNVPSATTESMFLGCTALTSCDVPCEMRHISDYTFSGCTSLTSYTTTPQFVEHIGVEAFKDCHSMNDILIGQYCSISTSSFENCYNAITITFDGVESNGDGKCNMNRIPDSAFTYCTSLTSTNFVYSNGSIYPNNSLVLPNSVEEIGNYSFFACQSISSCTIGNNVTSIGTAAFQNCFGLSSCTIGDNVTSIGTSAFTNCTSLISIEIPSGVTSIGESVFYNCSSLSSCTIGSGVTSIGEEAFYGCTSLTSITIPNSVTSIGEGAFSYCTKLERVVIPDSVTYIGNGAFCYCHLDDSSSDAVEAINPNAKIC